MLTEKNQYYLSTMGIDIWLAKTKKKSVAHHIFRLQSLSDERVGELWLESWKSDVSDEEVYKLLDAMLKAIHLKREEEIPGKKLDLTHGSQKICIVMGEALARQVLCLSKTLDELREGNPYQCKSQRILATYHPLQLLQRPSEKRKAWIDLQKIQ